MRLPLACVITVTAGLACAQKVQVDAVPASGLARRGSFGTRFGLERNLRCAIWHSGAFVVNRQSKACSQPLQAT